MQIAHLILAHDDPKHIGRLVRRLSSFSDVFIHIDKNADINVFKDAVGNIENCFFAEKRIHCAWGSWNPVVAEIELIRVALEHEKYDRLVFLQGADYPLKSNEYMKSFYQNNQGVEFVRACCCTGVADPYFYEKCRYLLFYNNTNKLKTLANIITMKYQIKLRDGYIRDDGKKYKVYWGSAQWAITGKCANYILEYYDTHAKFNRWFWNSFPADELYFSTIVMNSPFRDATLYHGPEPAKRGLVEWRNLHYFIYLPGKIKVFNETDFELLSNRSELYVRKVNTKESTVLLDRIEKMIEDEA